MATALAALSMPALADPVSDLQMEVGTRYWYSTGQAVKDLYDNRGSMLITRLDYDGLDAHAGEIYLRLDHSPSRLFMKGYLGVGGVVHGTMQDEDFEPFTRPYSRTLSKQDNGRISYLSLDAGYNLLQLGYPGGTGLRLGAFAGYHHYYEKYNAYGCEQLASHPTECIPPEPKSTKLATQLNDWHSLRLGMVADVWAMDRLRLTVDAAYIRTWLDGEDRHWLRPKINPLPEIGDGDGFQIEGVISYRLTDSMEIGIGGRYWQFGRINTSAHFERTQLDDATVQKETWKSKRYGVFLQLNWTF